MFQLRSDRTLTDVADHLHIICTAGHRFSSRHKIRCLFVFALHGTSLELHRFPHVFVRMVIHIHIEDTVIHIFYFDNRSIHIVRRVFLKQVDQFTILILKADITGRIDNLDASSIIGQRIT